MQFYLTGLRGKEYFAKEPEPVGAGYFWPLGAGAARKKIAGAGAGAAWEKKIRRSRSRLTKKSGAGAGAANKLAGSPALVIGVYELLGNLIFRSDAKMCILMIMFLVFLQGSLKKSSSWREISV